MVLGKICKAFDRKSRLALEEKTEAAVSRVFLRTVKGAEKNPLKHFYSPFNYYFITKFQ